MQTWGSLTQAASLPENGRIVLLRPHLAPLWPQGGSLREGGNGNRAGKKQKPYHSSPSLLLPPTFPPSKEQMEKEPRRGGPKARLPGAPPVSRHRYSGARPRGRAQSSRLSPHLCYPSTSVQTSAQNYATVL